MKTETKSFAEYKAPGCKVVVLQVKGSILSDSLNGGSDSLENMNNRDTSGWGWDDEE